MPMVGGNAWLNSGTDQEQTTESVLDDDFHEQDSEIDAHDVDIKSIQATVIVYSTVIILVFN